MAKRKKKPEPPGTPVSPVTGQPVPIEAGKPHRFQPGNPGGPGRPKSKSVTQRLKELVEENEGEIAGALAKAAVKAGLKGDVQFWREIVDRLDGKPKEEGGDSPTVRFEIIVAQPPAASEPTE